MGRKKIINVFELYLKIRRLNRVKKNQPKMVGVCKKHHFGGLEKITTILVTSKGILLEIFDLILL